MLCLRIPALWMIKLHTNETPGQLAEQNNSSGKGFYLYSGGARTPTLTEVCHGFPQSLQANIEKDLN